MEKSLLKVTKIINIDGKSFEYFDSQTKNVPTMIFFNGFRMHLDSWSNIVPEISNFGRIICYRAKEDQGSRIINWNKRRLKVFRKSVQ